MNADDKQQPSSANGEGRATHRDRLLQCDEIQAVLFDYMTRELGDARSVLVRAHLRKCPGCTAEAADIQKTIDLLRVASSDQTGLVTMLSTRHRKRMSRAVTHPMLDWIYCHHIVVSIIVAGVIMLGLMMILRHTSIWRKDRPIPGPTVIIGEPPPGTSAMPPPGVTP